MDNKYLAKALAICENNRNNNEKSLMENRLIAYKKSEELFKIDNLIKSNMSKVVLSAFNSDNDIEKTIENLKNNHKKLIAKRKLLLSTFSLPSNFLDMQYNCPICKDYGYIGTEVCNCILDHIESIKNQENTSVLSINNQTFERFNLEYYSKVPNIRYKLSPYDNAYRIFNRLKNYSENFSPKSENLIFSGASGLGKTFLSTAIATEVRKSGYSVVYDTAINVFDTFEAKKFNSFNETIAQKAQRYLDCDLLIIDDLGTELTTSYTTSVLYNIINSRIISEKPMILSTNMTLSDIAKKYSSPILSRVEGEFNLIYFFGDDIRKIKKNS